MKRMLTFLTILATASIATPLMASAFKGPYVWNQGDPPRRLEPVSRYVCVLTGVSGHFQGGGEKVLLRAQEGGEDPHWILEGASQQKGVRATAVCYSKGAFLTEGTDRAHSTSIGRAVPGSGCRTANVPVAFPNAASYISGMSGNFAGGGEMITINHRPHLISILNVSSCQPFLAGFAQYFRAGSRDTTRRGFFWGPNNTRAAVHVAGEYAAASSQGPAMVRMAPVENAMCYFTRLGGKFRGGGEAAEIVPESNSLGMKVWTLRVRSLQAQPHGVFASARCYSLNQR